MKETNKKRVAPATCLGVVLFGVTWVALARAAETGRSPALIYATTCGYCHGANVGPIILGRHLPAASTEAIVRNGPNAMPAFRPTEITNAELATLAKWIEASASGAAEHGQ